MSRTAIPREAAEEFGHILLTDDDGDQVSILKDEDLADLLGAEDGDVPSDEDAAMDETDPEPEPEPEPIEKGAVGEAIKIAKAAVQRLMSVVNKLKSQKEGSAKLPPPLANDVRTVARALAALAEKLGGKGDKEEGDKDAKTEKAAKDALAGVTAALERLMSVVNRLKALEPDAEVPKAVVNELRGVATALNSLVSRYGYPEQDRDGKGKGKDKEKDGDGKGKTEKLDRPEVFILKSDDQDPEMIIKAGRKMKRTRFSLFKKAVEMLTEILKELEDAKAGAAPAPKKPSKAEKADDDFQKQMLEGIAGIKEEVGKVSKRVDELETARPAGADEDPPKPVEKKGKGLWSSVLRLS